MIASYADKDTEKLASGTRVRKFEAIARAARKKLLILRASVKLEDLVTPPGNRKDGYAYDVEIVDYHS